MVAARRMTSGVKGAWRLVLIIALIVAWQPLVPSSSIADGGGTPPNPGKTDTTEYVNNTPITASTVTGEYETEGWLDYLWLLNLTF